MPPGKVFSKGFKGKKKRSTFCMTQALGTKPGSGWMELLRAAALCRLGMCASFTSGRAALANQVRLQIISGVVFCACGCGEGGFSDEAPDVNRLAWGHPNGEIQEEACKKMPQMWTQGLQ